MTNPNMRTSIKSQDLSKALNFYPGRPETSQSFKSDISKQSSMTLAKGLIGSSPKKD